ncbi:alpha/beta-hydrolase [Testicularia cyperi]|uniref:Alpha/beta-hydrolase n=1 Tax=Testicularia cyperi TaxID=1882483 RepID=A0A317XKR3_9BASI|nr:alpha/beta-hydrolase [Testicularia cyperi]
MAATDVQDRKVAAQTNGRRTVDAPHSDRHDALKKKLRKRQVKSMSKVAYRGTGVLDWARSTLADIYYFAFVWFPSTWWFSLTSVPNLIFDPVGLWSTLAFAAGSTVALLGALVVSIVWKLPFVQSIWQPYSKKKDVGLGNLAYPQIFEFDEDPMNKRIRDAAFTVMSEPLGPYAKPSTAPERIFDLEVSKLLMMLSALVYERDIEEVHNAAKTCVHKEKKHQKLYTGRDDELTDAGSEIYDILGRADRKIAKVAKQWGLNYATISELATNTSPLCGAFWNPDFNFLILAFKGTNPVEFKEWAIDMTFNYTDGREWLPGYTKVHSGFYNQIFPHSLNNATGVFPYTEIRTTVNEIVQQIRLTSGSDHVNLYVTGHSLGAALACTFYSRALMSPKDFGQNGAGGNQIVVRDAYCFGTPILGDPDCVTAFGQAVHEQSLDHPPSLWRITNRRDAVATLLPEGGDYRMLRHISPFSQLHFAHIGQEIQLTDNIHKVYNGPGTLLPIHTPVTIISHLEKGGAGPTVHLPEVFWLLERIPILRRMVAHMPSAYWERLTKVQAEYNVEYRTFH